MRPGFRQACSAVAVLNRHRPFTSSTAQALAATPATAASLVGVLTQACSRGTGIGVALPLAAGAALVSSTQHESAALEMLGSLPRSFRLLWWAIWAAYNFRSLAAAFAASSVSEEDYRLQLQELQRKAARRLLAICRRNGSVYVKAAQQAASMQSVPPAFRKELEGLEDQCLPHPFAAIDKVLLEELGAPAAELFAEFNPQATAAASLAQVHRATLADGTAVAVKVQYPGLEAAVAADLATMQAVAALAAFFFPGSDWRWLFAELRSKLLCELDFRHEASNAARLAACFEGRRDDVAVPSVVASLSTRKVLTMQWVDGAKVSDVTALRRRGLAPRQVGVTLLDLAAEMMCVHGFVHGDMHPGNVFVREQPRRHRLLRLLTPWNRAAKPQIVLIDHGLYFELDTEMRQLYCQLWCAFVLNDAATAGDVATRLAGPRAGRALPEVLRPRDWAKMSLEERRRVQQHTGVSNVGDLNRMLNEAPRALVDCLRATAMVRHTATRLGATVADRLRVNATQALHGLQVETSVTGRRRRVVYVGAMTSRWRRLHLWARIQAMRVMAWVSLMGVGGREDPVVPLVE